ncbi:MAG: YbhB/YbcL family Raf kinase inhibitor-like protein [Candidatus Aegiribacteria sp.]|nr:YbhB/YbcL family Raf kinase inhibitor-like protein [Candidatus Aegiribacteria sp.]
MSFRIVSSAFKDNDYIPPWYSRSENDSSPPIGWTKPPKGTACLALIVTCTDPNTDKVYCHWVMYNIPPKANTIYGNQPHKNVSHDGTLQGVNSFGGVGWDGPENGMPIQELVFRLYALNTKLDLPGGASYHDVMDVMEGHILEEITLTGRYSSH